MIGKEKSRLHEPITIGLANDWHSCIGKNIADFCVTNPQT
jgi:hypothetical protein